MDDTEQVPTSNTIDLTVDLVAAFVSNNSVPVSELHVLIASVHAALAGVGTSH